MQSGTLPKVELHCHLEGTITPDFALKLAEKRGVDLKALGNRDGTYSWHDFTSFLKAYDKVSDLLNRPQDYYDLTLDHLTRAAGQGVIYTEFFLSADHGRRINIDYADMVEAIDEACRHAEEASGIICRLISTCVRHLGPDAALDVARETCARSHPRVTGFGMGGDERCHHPSEFTPAFAMAHEAGLGCTVHAGEFGGPESVSSALDCLPVTRIGHGVRAAESPDLVKRLVDEQIVLEVCPGSNIALGLYESLAAHPLPALLAAGVAITVSSDDPPFFHTDMQAEYETLETVFGLSHSQINDLNCTGLQAAFVDEDTRKSLINRL
ncbi:adenosine deaminase [Coralliovum pocilloporae]|uniref:adenosine deaminase n=1 Tax=Coralliovum pocilloporae TaxID=3066369 RepID=UPI003306D255